MSRIGKKPVLIPAGVEIQLNGESVTVKGPKGSLTQSLHPHVQVTAGEEAGVKQLTVAVQDPENVGDRALWGLFRALIQNMVQGVTTGYSKQLEVNGVGYRAAVGGTTLTLELGYSHDIKFPIPQGIVITVDKNIVTVSGSNKQQVGETAARIRALRKPEPYKGTGIKYVEETIRRKAGKAATKGA